MFLQDYMCNIVIQMYSLQFPDLSDKFSYVHAMFRLNTGWMYTGDLLVVTCAHLWQHFTSLERLQPWIRRQDATPEMYDSFSSRHVPSFELEHKIFKSLLLTSSLIVVRLPEFSNHMMHWHSVTLCSLYRITHKVTDRELNCGADVEYFPKIKIKTWKNPRTLLDVWDSNADIATHFCEHTRWALTHFSDLAWEYGMIAVLASRETSTKWRQHVGLQSVFISKLSLPVTGVPTPRDFLSKTPDSVSTSADWLLALYAAEEANNKSHTAWFFHPPAFCELSIVSSGSSLYPQQFRLTATRSPTRASRTK